MAFKKFIFAFCAFVLCAGFSLSARAALVVGEKAPPLVAKAVGGEKVDLAKLKGRTVIVYLWDTTCAACVKDLKALRDFYNKYEDKGLVVIALSGDPQRLVYLVENADATVDYPVVMAANAKENGFVMPKKPPILYIIGPEGTVKSTISSPVTAAALAAAIFR